MICLGSVAMMKQTSMEIAGYKSTLAASTHNMIKSSEHKVETKERKNSCSTRVYHSSSKFFHLPYGSGHLTEHMLGFLRISIRLLTKTSLKGL